MNRITLSDGKEVIALSPEEYEKLLNDGKRVTSIQTGEAQEVPIEDLLMKLATVELVVEALDRYVEGIAAHDGQQTGNNMPPDPWVMAATYKNIVEVSHAIKCACWGHEVAHFH